MGLHGVLQLQDQAAGVEEPGGIEFLLEAARDQRQRWRQRMEHAILRHGHARRPEQRGVPACWRRACAARPPRNCHKASAGRRPTPAASDRDRARRRSAGQPPQRLAGFEEVWVCSRSERHQACAASGSIASPPICCRALASAGGAPDRRTHNMPSPPSASPLQLVADTGSGLPRHCAKQDSARLPGGPRQRHFPHGLRHDLSDTSRRAPKMPCEPASRRDTS